MTLVLGQTTPSIPLLFDRIQVKAHRDRAANSFFQAAFLKDRVVKDLCTRLSHLSHPFSRIVDLGSHSGQLSLQLQKQYSKSDLVSTDLSEAMVHEFSHTLRVVVDEEILPFAASSLDLVISALSLHWVNDFPGMLAQIRQCLKPNGLFMAALFGGDTLIELRDCLQIAELELQGGMSPRLSPLIRIKDAGALLQRAGFGSPVVDHDAVQVTYPNPLALLHDLRAMGETNSLYSRSLSPTSKALFSRAFEVYQDQYGFKDGTIPATFDIVTLTGWVKA